MAFNMYQETFDVRADAQATVHPTRWQDSPGHRGVRADSLRHRRLAGPEGPA
ncbi:hypothetical protein D3C72_2413710 [compost metagenome]